MGLTCQGFQRGISHVAPKPSLGAPVFAVQKRSWRYVWCVWQKWSACRDMRPPIAWGEARTMSLAAEAALGIEENALVVSGAYITACDVDPLAPNVHPFATLEAVWHAVRHGEAVRSCRHQVTAVGREYVEYIADCRYDDLEARLSRSELVRDGSARGVFLIPVETGLVEVRRGVFTLVDPLAVVDHRATRR